MLLGDLHLDSVALIEKYGGDGDRGILYPDNIRAETLIYLAQEMARKPAKDYRLYGMYADVFGFSPEEVDRLTLQQHTGFLKYLAEKGEAEKRALRKK